MIINSSAGHGKQDSKSCGAYTNLLKESVENRDINKDFIGVMKQEGHTVYDCTVDYPASQSDCINQIVKKCNSHKVDLDISIHFNSARKDLVGDGKIGGVECICYDDKGTSKAYADRICKELNKLGFTNRGVKYNKNLGYLASTNAQAIIVEVCFVDDKDDVELYKKVKSKIGRAIAQGVLNKTITEPSKPSNSNTIKIQVDGKVYNMDGVLIDGNNYLKVRELEKAGYKIGFVGSMATIDKP
ncbi:MAG: N-acetylmuramoyl-L-alanine amidase [Clostridium sp.]|uniref:N-acetylmuramoyl-L-alanine amidase n=1 Tax=Clostridium sp. TaxID=1506 RepID=UPI003EE72CBE